MLAWREKVGLISSHWPAGLQAASLSARRESWGRISPVERALCNLRIRASGIARSLEGSAVERSVLAILDDRAAHMVEEED